ncbi:hypothetical protein BGW80DRAFT_1361253 [Lactifluus volemus]|nr:hypothetical protein BGW80DRAFT_1361253 [Lactifluus volemus]
MRQVNDTSFQDKLSDPKRKWCIGCPSRPMGKAFIYIFLSFDGNARRHCPLGHAKVG